MTQLEESRQAARSVREELLSLRETSERAVRAAGHEARMASARADDAERRMRAAEEQVAVSQAEAARAREEASKSASRARACELAESRAREAEATRERAEAIAAAARAAEARTAAERDESRARATRELERADAHRADAEAARRASAEAADDARRAREQLATCEASLRVTRAECDALREQLVAASAEARGEAASRAEVALARLREEAAGEIARLREAAAAARIAESQATAAARADLTSQLSELAARHEALRSEHAAVLASLRAADARADAAAAEARGEARAAEMQLQQARASRDEADAAARTARADAAALREKLQAAREELLRAAGAAQAEAASLRARLEAAEAGLRSYEAIEAELDATIVDSAAATLSAAFAGHHDGDDSGNSADSDSHHVAEDGSATPVAASTRGRSSGVVRSLLSPLDRVVGAGLPTLQRRRVQQSLALARRALDAERALNDARAECRRLQAECDVERERAERLERLVGESTMPQEYAARRIATLEDEARSARTAASHAQARVAAAERRAETEAELRARAQDDLRRVLARREHVEEARRAVSAIERAGVPVVADSAASHKWTSREAVLSSPHGRIASSSPSNDRAAGTLSATGASRQTPPLTRSAAGTATSRPTSPDSQPPQEAVPRAALRETRSAMLGASTMRASDPPSGAPASTWAVTRVSFRDAVPEQKRSDDDHDETADVDVPPRFVEEVPDGDAPGSLPRWYKRERGAARGRV